MFRQQDQEDSESVVCRINTRYGMKRICNVGDLLYGGIDDPLFLVLLEHAVPGSFDLSRRVHVLVAVSCLARTLFTARYREFVSSLAPAGLLSLSRCLLLQTIVPRL